MIMKKVQPAVINTIIKLINCGKIAMDLSEKININPVVGQGKLCTPMLFNIYINDLLEDANKDCY